MGEAAGEGAADPDRQVANVADDLGQKRAERALGHSLLEGDVAGQRADPELAVGRTEPVELADPVDVDQDRGPRQTEVHRRHEALAARQHLRLVTMLRQQVERLVDRPRSVVLEGCWLHRLSRSPDLPWLAVQYQVRSDVACIPIGRLNSKSCCLA